MRISVSTPEELGKAIKANEDEIEITGHIKEEVLRIIMEKHLKMCQPWS